MHGNASFGRWVKERRKALDLTQDTLARQVGCALSTIKKIETGAARPSKQIAELLADVLIVPPGQRAAFVQSARAVPQADDLHPIAQPEEPPAPGTPPFKGLRAFEEADADLFFGRELLTARLVGHLGEHPFLAVVGASGSGKSSIVRAGLVPALKRGVRLAAGRQRLLAGAYHQPDGSPTPCTCPQTHARYAGGRYRHTPG